MGTLEQINLDIPNAERPIQVLARRALEQPNQVFLRQPRGGQYFERTWSQTYEQVLRLANGFRSLGLQPGDKVAILSENCAEWFICDFAISAAGLISVPIYFTAGESIISYVLEHSDSKAIVVGKLANYSAAEKGIPAELMTIGMPYDSLRCLYQMEQLIKDSEPLSSVAVPEVDDIFSISYTSGSTGKPKGVVLSYRNIMFGGISAANLLDGNDEQQRALSYLPLAHITERALVEYASLYTGAIVTFNETLDTFLNDLRSAQVTFFISVPRLWLKFQSGILAGLPQKKLDRLLKVPVLNRVVKHRIKKKLGLDKIYNCGSGSAPISPALLQWYQKVGIDISEGWGMTELSGMATTHLPFRKDKLGTIGQAMPGLDIRLSDIGEMLVKGDGVFKEYYKNPEATKEAFTEDGYMRTGDKADIDDDGYLKITGRVKELFKSGKGKYVAPVPIESKMGDNQLIDQICVMGSGLPKPIAVVVLAAPLVQGMRREAIETSLLETLHRVNKTLEKHEQLGGLRIVAEGWTVENDLLTPTLKFKRTKVEEKYHALVAQEGELLIWESSELPKLA